MARRSWCFQRHLCRARHCGSRADASGMVIASGIAYMPLARFYLHSQGVEVWLAPTLAAGDAWISTMQHIACENRMFVIGVNPVLHLDAIPAEFPNRDQLVA